MDKKLLFPLVIFGLGLMLEYIIYVLIFGVPLFYQTKQIFDYVLVAGNFEVTKIFIGTILSFLYIIYNYKAERKREKLINMLSIGSYFVLSLNFFVISLTFFIFRILPSFRLSYQVLTSSYGSIIYFSYGCIYLYLGIFIIAKILKRKEGLIDETI